MADRQYTPGQLYGLAWIFYLVLAVGGVVWLGFQRGQIPLELFVDPAEWWQDVLLGVGAGGALILAWEGVRRAYRPAQGLEEKLGQLLLPLTSGEAVSLAVFSGVAEELFFRGAVQGAWGWIVATALFAFLHTGPGREYRVWTLFAAVAGALFAGLVIWRGSLLAAIEAHALVNAVGLRRAIRAAAAGDE